MSPSPESWDAHSANPLSLVSDHICARRPHTPATGRPHSPTGEWRTLRTPSKRVVLRAPPMSSLLRMHGEDSRRLAGRHSEKNWVFIPFQRAGKGASSGAGRGKLRLPDAARAFFSRRVCPHEVVSCSLQDGSCALAYATMLAGCDPALHGGPPLLPVSIHGEAHSSTQHDGRAGSRGNGTTTATMLVGVAHVRLGGHSLRHSVERGYLVDRVYMHYFYRVDPTPPFAVRKVTPAFRLPPLFHNDLDRVQFCSGLTQITNPSTGSSADALRLMYGVGDCGAASVDVPLRYVRRLLQQ